MMVSQSMLHCIFVCLLDGDFDPRIWEQKKYMLKSLDQ